MWPKATTINWRSNLQLEPASVGNNNTGDNGTSKQKKIAKTRDAKCATLTLMSFLTRLQLHLSFKRLLHLNLRQCHKPLCISEHILYRKLPPQSSTREMDGKKMDQPAYNSRFIANPSMWSLYWYHGMSTLAYQQTISVTQLQQSPKKVLDRNSRSPRKTELAED